MEAEDFKKAIEAANFTVSTVEAKPARRNPQAPFTTSTLQQEASRKLGFAPAHTMRIAQRLYEGIDIGGETAGLITYMRTDGVQIANEAITQARKLIGEDYGNAYVPDAPRQYQTKAKNAQEAHEAIRPTDLSRRPADMRRRLDTDQARLYELIWIRTIASQMESAELERTTVDIAAKAGARVLELRATGQVIKFDGFLRSTRRAATTTATTMTVAAFPPMSEGEALRRQSARRHPAFHRAAAALLGSFLVKRMEELGIGRPSTYASILQVLKDRGYVRLDKKRLHGGGQGPRRGRGSWKISSPAMSNMISPPLPRGAARPHLQQRDFLAAGAEGFLGRLHRRRQRDQGPACSRCSTRSTNMLGPHIYAPRGEMAAIPGNVRPCGTGELNPQGRKVRRLCRLLQLY